ncbi:MAG: hypothetical protein PHH84_01340 [Oscillospiraceae bacterium]|nr:hypothetical protein [Oscillospiraceae bacterium]MDD4413498.1 hypothetical protein [Oscillospiraceae bacterium]
MRFFNFLRRINRGIVLAIVLIIGLSCYLTVDGIAFKDEKEAIKQVLEDYAEDMESFLLLPEQYREIGTSVPDSVIENKIKENNNLISKYFINGNTGGWNMKESITQDLERKLKNNQETGNKVKSFDASLKRVKSITKHGASLVTVEAVMSLMSTATTEAELFHIFQGGGKYYYENPDKSEDITFSTQSDEITFTCEMVKRNGAWMFSNYESMYTNY